MCVASEPEISEDEAPDWLAAQHSKFHSDSPSPPHTPAQVYRAEGIIYMVLECGEIDLARLLQKREAARREQGQPVSSLDENFIRLYWEQMLTVRG